MTYPDADIGSFYVAGTGLDTEDANIRENAADPVTPEEIRDQMTPEGFDRIWKMIGGDVEQMDERLLELGIIEPAEDSMNGYRLTAAGWARVRTMMRKPVEEWQEPLTMKDPS